MFDLKSSISRYLVVCHSHRFIGQEKNLGRCIMRIFLAIAGLIGFFSFIMGSINTVLLTDVGESDEIAEKIEQVDIWLVALDNAKKEKSLPNVLYNSIKVYIKN